MLLHVCSVVKYIANLAGRVVTISSGLSLHGLFGRSGYCVPKAGVEIFMNVLRYEMRKFGVKVNNDLHSFVLFYSIIKKNLFLDSGPGLSTLFQTNKHVSNQLTWQI